MIDRADQSVRPGARRSRSQDSRQLGRQAVDNEHDDQQDKTKDDETKKDDKSRGDDKSKEDGKNKDGGKKEPKSRWPLVILGIVVVLVIIGGVFYWYLNRNLESTDDAYTEGNAVSITPKVSGYVVERRVDDNSNVRAGELMLRIDPRDYITARDQARANLDLARAQLSSAEVQLQITRVQAPADLQQAQAQLAQSRANQVNAQREYRRQHNVDPRATTQTSVDQASAQFRSSNASVNAADAQVQIAAPVPQNIKSAEDTVKQRAAQVEQAEANLAQAELNLSYTYVRAPQSGHVTQRNVDVGTYAQAGQQVFYLVTPDLWVVANFKETQLARMQPGQAVTIRVDAYPKLKLNAHVESIQQGSGARFTAFPAENATGNFVKIVRRVPVKMTIDGGIDPYVGLPLGLSVEPTVHLK